MQSNGELPQHLVAILSYDVRYSEALAIFKSSYDPIWQAAATESLATVAVLDAWAAGQTAVRCFSASWVILAHLPGRTTQHRLKHLGRTCLTNSTKH